MPRQPEVPRPPTTVALLPGEDAGRIRTVSAGSVSFEAVFSAPPGEDLPPPTLPDPPAGVLHHAIRAEGDGGTWRVSCEIRATRASDLAATVDGLLRSASAHAALSSAVLETRVVRLGEPVVPHALLVGGLARALRSSGIAVSFGPSWEPAQGAEICVGVRGRELEIERFLRESPAWQPVLP